MLKHFAIMLLAGFVPLLSIGQNFTLSTIDLMSLYSGVIRWADLDNDGDLDIVYNGLTEGANEFHTKVYENNNGSFTIKETGLPDIRNGAFAFGDYDKDGDLDILLTGLSNDYNNISVLFENLGDFSFELKDSYPGLINSIPVWFDIDDDGDLDFLLAGTDEYAGEENPFIARMHVYENSGSGFDELPDTNLPPCSQCSIDIGDINGDGRLDVIITGLDSESFALTGLYLNNGDKTFSIDENSELHQVFNGNVKLGDFDNDGDLDVILGGGQMDGIYRSSIYENISGILTEREEIQITPATENWQNGLQWVDYNQDGNLDIIITGRSGSPIAPMLIFKIFRNNGDETFSEVAEENFFGLALSSIDFGDFDNDGDPDLAFIGTGTSGVRAGVFLNELNIVGLGDALEPTSVTIYPNPTNGILTFDFQTVSPFTKVIIYDALGRKVLHQTIDDSEVVINVNELKAGIYVVDIVGLFGKVIYRRRILKE